MSLDFFILAAEPSADVKGAKLIEDLLKIDPHLKIGAVSGPHMRKLPIHTYLKMEELQVMGFTDVFLALPKLIRLFFFLKRKILNLNPKALITIDYPGFNLRLVKSLRKQGFSQKAIHYVAPTVWAWGKKRVFTLEKHFDLLLTLFPFEKKFFSNTTLPVTYIGHPLLKAIPPNEGKKEQILALFPGSRQKELERNLPFQIMAAKELQKKDPHLKIAISVSSLDKEAYIKKLSKDLNYTLVLPDEKYELMRKARLALATSGTVTLELALHKTPTLVTYKIRPIDQFLATQIFKINLPFYCIVNIIREKEVFPEAFGAKLAYKELIKKAEDLWTNESLRTRCIQGCEEVRNRLFTKDASYLAASESFKILESSTL